MVSQQECFGAMGCINWIESQSTDSISYQLSEFWHLGLSVPICKMGMLAYSSDSQTFKFTGITSRLVKMSIVVSTSRTYDSEGGV
jgi:hypothetical protein